MSSFDYFWSLKMGNIIGREKKCRPCMCWKLLKISSVVSRKHLKYLLSTQHGDMFTFLLHSKIIYVCLYACLPVSFCLSVCLPVCLSVCLSVRLPVCLSVGLSVCRCVCLSVCLPICLSTRLPTCLPVFVSICLSICLPVRMTHDIYTLSCLFGDYLHATVLMRTK